MSADPSSLAQLVDFDAGTVAGRAFVDDAIYELELERVFARAWCYLADLRGLREPGQFVSTFTGEDPVTVVRQPDGSAKAMLNSCRHRGLPVCGPAGQAERLVCGYHGWTFALDGRLVDLLDGDEEFRQWAADRALALVPVTRTAEVSGLMLGCWDLGPELADRDRDALDGFVATGSGEPLVRAARPIRFDANWKVVAEALAGIAEEGGASIFPATFLLSTHGLLAALHPKGPHACLVSVSRASRAPERSVGALEAAIRARLQPEGPSAVTLTLKGRAPAVDGCPADDVPVALPPRRVRDGALMLYRAWIEQLLDERPLAGLRAC